MTDELEFVAEVPAGSQAKESSWLVLIVDDEPEIHAVTQLALNGFTHSGRSLKFLNAYSAAQARQILSSQDGIALVLLDVVMETDHAGLDLVEYIRNELGNRFIRIVLRTGQPGQAPEISVITRYDINDYKNKTELTRERLFTAVYTGIATYRDLVALDANRRGLEKVIEASAHIFELRSLEKFAQGVLEQLAALLFLDQEVVMVHASGLAAKESGLRVIAGTGIYATMIGRMARDALSPITLQRVDQATRLHASIYAEDHFVGYYGGDSELLFYVGADTPFSLQDRRLMELFHRNVGIAIETLRIMQRDKP